MDFDARLKAIARLAESSSDAAQRAVERELDSAAAVLATSTDYDQLDQKLAIVNATGFRHSAKAVRTLVDFVDSIERRQLTYANQERVFESAFQDYRNSSTLVVRAIQGLVRLRYLQTDVVLQSLVRLSSHPMENVRKAADIGLDKLVAYDLDVFYGANRQGGIGAKAQQQVVETLRQYDDDSIAKHFSPVVRLLRGALSPTITGISATYNAVTLSHAPVPPLSSIADLRASAIELLIRAYRLASTMNQRLAVISALTEATRREARMTRTPALSAIIVRDSLAVLAFFEELVETEDLQVVQKIEHNAYWIHYHGTEDIRSAALQVRDRLSLHKEYEIFRNLIGFEGIFVDWESPDDRHGLRAMDEVRREKAREYAVRINEANYNAWRLRILAYAQIKSDDLATFPVFYHFLESFAVQNPELALKLLTEDSERIKRFLIPILRGLWPSRLNAEVRALIETWIRDGRHLHPAIKQFLSANQLDLELLRRLLKRADETDDVSAIREAVAVGFAHYRSAPRALLDALLLPAIKMLTRRSRADWVFDNWYQRETLEALESLDGSDVDVVLQNLEHLPAIDFHAEEVLYGIAKRAPEKVIAYLCQRLDRDSRAVDASTGAFEAIPFEFHKLSEPLSNVPRLAVRMLRERYSGDFSAFLLGGARLLRNIFPTFSGDFEAELLGLVRKADDRDLEFVLAILQNYHGETFVHRLCKEIVKRVPTDSRFHADVAIALESTGVVRGELGLAEAYERKRKEIACWLDDPEPRVQEFAKRHIAMLEQVRDAEQRRAEEDIVLRKFHYDET